MHWLQICGCFFCRTSAFLYNILRVWMVRIVWLSFLVTFDYVTTGYFFVEKIELNVIAAGFGIFSSNEFYSSNGKALGWLVFFQLDLERGGSNDVATTDDVCSISRKVKLILWLFAIKWHLHSSEHRRLLVLSQFSLLTLRPVDRSSSLVFNVRPWLYTTMIRTYVLKHRQFASCLYYYLQTSTLLEEYWCAAVCVFVSGQGIKCCLQPVPSRYFIMENMHANLKSSNIHFLHSRAHSVHNLHV